ncbi:OpgC domain-containing protein [Mesorhizobium sp. CAU 1732]|uniref:OpgC family protein n=1 Tax=Mesorhizobium sp. CAU 1732 TaxID=3140358 RepID=UPI0032608E4B
MKRLDIIDGMRGYFLVFMLINHLVFVGGYWLVEINHRQLAFVEDAQGFVFLSGLLIGLVYARKMLKYGRSEGAGKVYARAFELYRYAMGLVIVVLLARLALPGGYEAWWNWLGDTNLTDPKRLAAIATFIFQPTFMDILPQYTVYMLFAPAVIWLVLNGKWASVAIGSFIIWMGAQLGLQAIVTDPLNTFFMGSDDQGVRVSFNMMGWQVIFFGALVLGVLTAQDKIDWSRILSPERTLLPKAALAICVFFVPLRIATAWGLMPEIMLGKFATMEIRADFGPVYLVNFVAVAFGMTWLLVAGPRHENAIVRGIANALIWVFTLRFLQLLGRHSLHVYVWHVAIVYAVYYVDQRTPELSQFMKTVIAIISIGLLAIPAVWRERERFLGERGPFAGWLAR